MCVKVLGADFATTNGTVAYLDGDGTMHLPTYPSNMASGMPMLFMYDSHGKEWVGDQVITRNGLISEPNAVCQSVKMKLRADNITLSGRTFTPNYIAAAIAGRQLEFGRQALARNLVDIDPDVVVVPVPATATAAERGETLDIHKKVYRKSHIPLVDEPTAIALAYLYQKSRTTVPTRRVLVHDSGGGTTDVAFLTPSSGSEPFETNHPKGIRVAGDDLDKAMLQTVLAKLRSSPGTLNMTIVQDTSHFVHRRLLSQCRTVKENLTLSDSYTMEVSDSCGGYSSVTVTREEYENAIRPLIQKMVDLAEEVLKACNLGDRPDIDIILAGGTANTPLLQQMMRERFPWVNADCFVPRLGPYAVAMGAALYGARKQQLPTRSTYGYAVRVLNEDNTKEHLQVVIPPNVKMPCKVESRFRTAWADQTTCALHIYEVTKGYTDQILELEEGVETDYVLTHRFPQAVPLHTGITLSAELTKDGILHLVSRDQVSGGLTCEKQFTVSNMKYQEEHSGTAGQNSEPDSDKIDSETIRKALFGF